MTFPGAMKLKPETAEEINDCMTPDGLRRRLREYAYRGGEPMVRAIFEMAAHRGLSGEDTMVWLAFEALKGMEQRSDMLIEQFNIRPAPRIVPAELVTTARRAEDK
jgi:hypothetical protein